MKTSTTIKLMILFTIFLLSVTVGFYVLFNVYGKDYMRILYITFLTIFYHFAMRLFVGETVTVIYKNREFNIDSFGFKIRSFEPRLYKFLKVKKWKIKVITAKPEQFDLTKVSKEELLHNMLQAELVHRIIMVLSFLPLLLIIPYGCPSVFILTSVFACLIDLIFVIIQRYNRPRIIRLIARTSNKN